MMYSYLFGLAAELLIEMLKLNFSNPFCCKFKKDTLKFDLCSKSHGRNSNGLHPCLFGLAR